MSGGGEAMQCAEGERQWHHDPVIMCERGKDKGMRMMSAR